MQKTPAKEAHSRLVTGPNNYLVQKPHGGAKAPMEKERNPGTRTSFRRQVAGPQTNMREESTSMNIDAPVKEPCNEKAPSRPKAEEHRIGIILIKYRPSQPDKRREGHNAPLRRNQKVEPNS